MKFVQTTGGAFILLPLELRKDWDGAGDDPDSPKSDYAKTRPFAGKVGLVKVGKKGSALILGNPLETTFVVLPDGGVFVQRSATEEEEEIKEAVEHAVAATEGWAVSEVVFEVGDKGRLALMDSYDTYADTEKEDRIEVALAPGRYAIDECAVRDEEEGIDLHLVRLKKA